MTKDISEKRGRKRKPKTSSAYYALGQAIEAARTAAGYSVDYLAKVSDVGTTTIYEMERGLRLPLYRTMLAIAEVVTSNPRLNKTMRLAWDEYRKVAGK